MMARSRSWTRLLLLPVTDTWCGLERCLNRGWRGLLGVALGLLAGWWVYVPVHELLHAAACRAAGGEVHRLEIGPLYGGVALAPLFPFVVAGGYYAGRLSGFDTHGSDWIYLATDLGPFVLTLIPGVWALRRAGAAGRPFLFGAALPFALAPFLSLTGDAYEIGSILVTQLPPWSAPTIRNLLRGDDLWQRLAHLARATPPAPWGGAALATLVGLAWAWATYATGAALAHLAGATTPPFIPASPNRPAS